MEIEVKIAVIGVIIIGVIILVIIAKKAKYAMQSAENANIKNMQNAVMKIQTINDAERIFQARRNTDNLALRFACESRLLDLALDGDNLAQYRYALICWEEYEASNYQDQDSADSMYDNLLEAAKTDCEELAKDVNIFLVRLEKMWQFADDCVKPKNFKD